MGTEFISFRPTMRDLCKGVSLMRSFDRQANANCFSHIGGGICDW